MALVASCPVWLCHAVESLLHVLRFMLCLRLWKLSPWLQQQHPAQNLSLRLTLPATKEHSSTGPPRQCLGQSDLHAAPARLNSGQASVLQQASGTLPQSQHSGHVQTTFGHATLEELRAASEKFAADRDWDKFHSPRNLLLALVMFLVFDLFNSE